MIFDKYVQDARRFTIEINDEISRLRKGDAPLNTLSRGRRRYRLPPVRLSRLKYDRLRGMVHLDEKAYFRTLRALVSPFIHPP